MALKRLRRGTAALKHGLYRRDPPLIVALPADVNTLVLAEHFRQMAVASLELAECLNLHDTSGDEKLSHKISGLIGTFAAISSEMDHFAALLAANATPPAVLGDIQPEAFTTLLDHQRRALSVVLSRIRYAVDPLCETPLRQDGSGLSAHSTLIQLMRRAKRIAADLAAVIAYGQTELSADSGDLRERMLAVIEGDN